MLTEYEYQSCKSCAYKLRLIRSEPSPANETSGDEWSQADVRRLKALASFHFPEALPVCRQQDTTEIEATQRLLEKGVPVARPRFAASDSSCRADFATADATTLRLYCVVPKCLDLDAYHRNDDSLAGPGKFAAEWRSHLELMAFRLWTVQQQFGDRYRILGFFIVPAKDAATRVEGLGGRCDRMQDDPGAASKELITAAAHLLRFVGVSTECVPLIDSVAEKSKKLAAAVDTAKPVRRYACKHCEMLTPCWGALASVKPHMFDLNRLWFVNDPIDPRQRLADRLARQGQVALADIPIEAVDGRYAHRQSMQIRGEATQSEIIIPGLEEKLLNVTYPLFGFDIETSNTIVPIHAGKVNEQVVFQYAATRQDHVAGPLQEFEWLNTRPENPNSRFVESLRATLGDSGSVLVYSEFEEMTFRRLIEESIRDGDDGDDIRWLHDFVESRRIVDLHQIVFDHWWAPGLGGKTSLKAVLPVLWSLDSTLKHGAPFNEIPPDVEPYTYLKSRGGIGDGLAAMAAYSELQVSTGNRREELENALRKYVGVDAWSMNYVRSVLLARTSQISRSEARAA